MEDLELEAMQKINKVLVELGDEKTIRRVLQWAISRHGASIGVESFHMVGGEGTTRNYGNARESTIGVAEFFDAANPRTEAEKVLVVAYWLQEIQGHADWDSQSVNTELKNLGHGVGNITRALDTLIARRPRLVIQTKKSGTTKQARKKYKVTVEGTKSVRTMGTNETDTEEQIDSTSD